LSPESLRSLKQIDGSFLSTLIGEMANDHVAFLRAPSLPSRFPIPARAFGCVNSHAQKNQFALMNPVTKEFQPFKFCLNENPIGGAKERKQGRTRVPSPRTVVFILWIAEVQKRRQ
jgi:hypothetical protein